MPIYQYACQKCGENFEVEQSMKDDALTTHDNCGGDLNKIYSASGIILKGSGFFKTDNKSSIKPNAKKPKSTKTEVKKTESKKDTSK